MGDEDPARNTKPNAEQSALLAKPTMVLTAQQRSDLMDAALTRLETVLKDRPHPYRIRISKSEDNTRSIVRLARGRFMILLCAFYAGLCVLYGLGCLSDPWYIWVFLLEVDPHGRIGIKFSIANNSVTYILTCILGSLIMPLFSHCEHTEMKRTVTDILQDSADAFFAERGLGVAPEAVDVKSFDDFIGDDDGEEDEDAFLSRTINGGTVGVNNSTYGSV